MRTQAPLTNEAKEFNHRLNALLEEILQEKVGNLPKAERDLIIYTAREMIKNDKINFPEGLSRHNLKDKDTRALLSNTLIAATSVGLYITEHMRVHELCRSIMDRYEALKLIPEPKDEKAKLKRTEELQAIKDEFKDALGQLNRLEPNPLNRENNQKMIDDNDILDKLIDTKGLVKDKQQRDAERGKKDITPEDAALDKSLDDALQNLFGLDPHIAGKITGPVMVVIGNFMGIPDAYPAYSPAEPIHRLSGDLSSSGDKYFHSESPDSAAPDEAGETLAEYMQDLSDLVMQQAEEAQREGSETPIENTYLYQALEMFSNPAEQLMNSDSDLNDDLYHVSQRMNREPPTAKMIET